MSLCGTCSRAALLRYGARCVTRSFRGASAVFGTLTERAVVPIISFGTLPSPQMEPGPPLQPAPGLSPARVLPLSEAGDTHRAAGPRSCWRAQLRECGGPAEACCAHGVRGGVLPRQPLGQRMAPRTHRPAGAARRPPFLEGKSEGSDCNFKDSARLPLLATPAGLCLAASLRPLPAHPRLGGRCRTRCDLQALGWAARCHQRGLLPFCGGFTEAGSRPSETVAEDVSRRLS